MRQAKKTFWKVALDAIVVFAGDSLKPGEKICSIP
jgi:hypothetical protein